MSKQYLTFFGVLAILFTGTIVKLSVNLNAKIIEQRNSLSKVANTLMQKYMKYDCDVKKKAGEKTNADKVSLSGGFCETAGKTDSGQHVHDKALIAHLSTFFEGKNVGSFGEGPGSYKSLLLATGKLKSYTGYDGSPYASENSDGEVEFLDLTIDAFNLPAFDWILSLEVAEHIPAEFESKFLSNIVRHAKEGIVMSWAKPGQGGLHHVNNRALTYIISTMDSLGFRHDPDASKAIQAACSVGWLRDNTNVYRRKLSNPLNPHFL